jgi:hypothetical protein
VKSKIKILVQEYRGFSAAINLATAGYEVEVYERKAMQVPAFSETSRVLKIIQKKEMYLTG